ncbi:MAG: MBL fold metallo-hydrolase [Bacillota bacterium]
MQLQTLHQRLTARGGLASELTSDLAWLQTAMVNLYLIGPEGSSEWVLVDTGLPGFASRIERAAAQRYGDFAPQAIILTHGHFDHVGSLEKLLDRWMVPVYAHELELPYLTGRSDYPPPDPAVGGGLMARLAPLYPRRAIDLDGMVQPLPIDGSVPHMPGWRWIHTPGHTPGHISLYRDSDRTLIAGDAFTTQKQESLLAVLTNHQQIHGPPAYFTIDWMAAWQSVRHLAALDPEIAATGHGIPITGIDARSALHRLADRFGELAIPPDGRYVREPAIADADGIVSVPPPIASPYPRILAATAVTALTLAAISGSLARRRRH